MRKLMHFSTIFKASNHLLGYGVFVSLKYKHRASKRTINHHLTMFGSEKMVTCAKQEHFLQLFPGLRSISNFASLYQYPDYIPRVQSVNIHTRMMCSTERLKITIVLIKRITKTSCNDFHFIIWVKTFMARLSQIQNVHDSRRMKTWELTNNRRKVNKGLF